MPTCKKCHNYFKNWVEIDKKKRNLSKRLYCLDCSPWKKHNTRSLESNRVIVHKCVCKMCNKSFIYSRNKGGTKDKCSSCWSIKSRRDKRDNLIKKLGSKCSVCGYNKYNGALEFHHKDPETKLFELSARNFHRKVSVLEEEAKKCILLCSNCHRELHGEVSPHSDKV